MNNSFVWHLGPLKKIYSHYITDVPRGKLYLVHKAKFVMDRPDDIDYTTLHKIHTKKQSLKFRISLMNLMTNYFKLVILIFYFSGNDTYICKLIKL